VSGQVHAPATLFPGMIFRCLFNKSLMPVWKFSTRKETLAVAEQKKKESLSSAPCSPYIKLDIPILAFHRPNNYIDLLKPPILNGQQPLEHNVFLSNKWDKTVIRKISYPFLYLFLSLSVLRSPAALRRLSTRGK